MGEDKKNLIVIIGGALIVLVIAIFGAKWLSKGHENDPRMNTKPTGLQVSVTEAPTGITQKTLRCFVNGAYVGDFSLSECAQKNGVAAQSLDVGLDDKGNPTAAPTASLAPPTSAPPKNLVTTKTETDTGSGEETMAQGACLRYAGGDWSEEAVGLSLAQCAHRLYDGHCERPGSASYGRWANQTLRLVPGRVEVSVDNHNFHTLYEQVCTAGGH